MRAGKHQGGAGSERRFRCAA